MTAYTIKCRAGTTVLFDFERRVVKFERTGILNSTLGIINVEIPFEEITCFVLDQASSRQPGSVSLIVNNKSLYVHDGQKFTDQNLAEAFVNLKEYTTFELIIGRFRAEICDVPVHKKGQITVQKTKYDVKILADGGASKASKEPRKVCDKVHTKKQSSTIDAIGKFLVTRVNPIFCVVVMIAAMVAAGVIVEDIETAIFVIAVVAVIGIAFMIFMAVYSVKVKKDIDELNETVDKLVYYPDSKNKGTLYVKATDPVLAKAFSIEAHMNYTMGHEDAKLHVGAVTVGGVTTGGAYVTEGYNYVSGREKSGKYKLLFRGESVALIKLPAALYQRAKESPIADYLEDGCCIRVIQPVRSVLEQEAILAEYKRTGYVGNHPELYPTFEKATAILNWLTTPTNNE